MNFNFYLNCYRLPGKLWERRRGRERGLYQKHGMLHLHVQSEYDFIKYIRLFPAELHEHHIDTRYTLTSIILK